MKDCIEYNAEVFLFHVNLTYPKLMKTSPKEKKFHFSTITKNEPRRAVVSILIRR